MARNNNKNGKILNTQQAVNQTIINICDIMRRSNCAGAMEYVPELTWILFLRILDERESYEAEEAEAVGRSYSPSLQSPYRWQDWAAPGGPQRLKLQEQGGLGDFFNFLHNDLFPYLRSFGNATGPANPTPRQRIIGRIFANVTRTRIDTEYNMWEVIDKVNDIKDDAIDSTHVFPLSQVYEGLLLRMGEKRNDGGQFFTPREVIRAMVRAIDPRVGQTIYDPGCGTGGFLAQAYEYMKRPELLPTELESLKHDTFYGREKDNVIYPIALANLVLHGVDFPNLWHGNTLTGRESYADLFRGAPEQFNIILTNPPFGGKEGKEAQTHFDYKTGSTQVLFLQHVINHLAHGGRCGIVVDEGVLFRTNETAFVKTKKKLLDECNLWCIVSLPGGVFTEAGAGVKTNILFFTKGQPTEKIWYYDLSHLKIRKRSPLKLSHFDDFFKLLPQRADSRYSWTVDIEARRIKAAEEAEPFYKEAQANQREANQLKRQLDACKKERAEQARQLRRLEKQIADARAVGQATALLEPELKTLTLTLETTEADIEQLSEQYKTTNKEARDLRNRAQAIEDAAYDLKAVNPHDKPVEDTRTPQELIAIIEQKGQEVAQALALLRG